jgi:hypothetical protein
MDQEQVYQWMETLSRRLPLGKWQSLTLAGFSLGVMEGEKCQLSRVAERLGLWGKADSVERRLQRWLDNERIDVAACQAAWVKWVMSTAVAARQQIYLLVDETKLSTHLSSMMVGLAYRHRCIGLVWCSYHPDAWPCRQVELIGQLLRRVQAVLDPSLRVIVEADRGIGTSPDLVQVVLDLGWDYLFRVQGITHFRAASQPDCELRRLTIRGGPSWGGTGQVFKAAGWIDTQVRVIWEAPYDEPWCLISNRADLTGREYARRNWHEQSFRDLKSGGWQWNHSQVWQPDHADRLLLVLFVAYALTLSLGLRVDHDPALRAEVTRGQRTRFSLFRLGLRVFGALQRLAQPIRLFLDLFAWPDPFLPHRVGVT